ncbi:hypothetical protein GN330_22625 [Nitratireductor sp. CAU 1489]|uniref:Peptidase S74 domain-containing protein n=1 Tax=Nitratireductor arenosus TaxID=2682096 RepID=A0A844QR44_9HYPH|nr:tail fiber domain-containing protein [Nitratireductor arenosus]MVB00050.1 hypothetical protein [Nitratireductor arenosus]
MGKPKPPAPPDPRETSAAQTGTSVATALANAMLGNVNRVGPEGSVTYDQSGEYSFTDPYTGQTYHIPRFTENVQLSDNQQRTYDRQQDAEFNLADLAAQQSGFLTDYMAEPIDLSNEATEARLFELGSKRLDPRFAREEEAMRTNLLNRGIREGSDAFSAAMGDFNQGRNDAYNQLLLTGRGQAVQEALAQRSQPINEIASLLGGSQVNIPQFTGGNMPTIPTTDNAGLINQNYNQQLQNWQIQNQQRNSLLGGLFGLGSSLIMSDKRTKEDIEKVGKTDDGQAIYKFRYKGSPLLQMGLMAQEVEKKKPGAVKEVAGIKMVDYGKALEGA